MYIGFSQVTINYLLKSKTSLSDCKLYWSSSPINPAVRNLLPSDCRILHFPNYAELTHKYKLLYNMNQ